MKHWKTRAAALALTLALALSLQAPAWAAETEATAPAGEAETLTLAETGNTVELRIAFHEPLSGYLARRGEAGDRSAVLLRLRP